MILDKGSYTLSQASTNDKISLTKKEFELLYKLLSFPNQIFTYRKLLDQIWGIDSCSTEDTVRTHVNRVRKKCCNFSEFQIETVKGLGYKGEIISEF